MNQKLFIGIILLTFGLLCFCTWIFAAFRPQSGDGLLIGLFIASLLLVGVGTGITYEELDN